MAICFDIDEEHACFTYMLGVGVDAADADVPPRPGTHRHVLSGGLYAVFTTPLVAEDAYVQSIQDTWQKILTQWLPASVYAYDDARMAYEYYDERDHAWLHDGKSRMEIRVPVCARG